MITSARRLPVVFAALVTFLLAAVPFLGPAPCPHLAAAPGSHVSADQPTPDCAVNERKPQLKAALPSQGLDEATTPSPVPAQPVTWAPPPAARPPSHFANAVDLNSLSVLRT
ncbi:hypothetical protein JOF53_005262 [Crossiella equi]|uniref:Secreted protein n=1 Tax=Crossiella equi TaxID=130796 RepID=A0ABS5AII1_9PSEU|nr:hypothetical protein [Crossiella equi]MBP2476390.1 hypothetical protein [Crossiella equi]